MIRTDRIRLKTMLRFNVLIYRGIRDGWHTATNRTYSQTEAQRMASILGRINPSLVYKVSQAY
jgi:hypothetical protein